MRGTVRPHSLHSDFVPPVVQVPAPSFRDLRLTFLAAAGECATPHLRAGLPFGRQRSVPLDPLQSQPQKASGVSKRAAAMAAAWQRRPLDCSAMRPCCIWVEQTATRMASAPPGPKKSREQGAGRREQGAESTDQRAGRQRAGRREEGAGSREQGGASRQLAAGSRQQAGGRRAGEQSPGVLPTREQTDLPTLRRVVAVTRRLAQLHRVPGSPGVRRRLSRRRDCSFGCTPLCLQQVCQQ